jgi:hypothetical protein
MALSLKRAAEAILRSEVALLAESDSLNKQWEEKVEELSRLCLVRGASRTHIALLGTSILAKATDAGVDLLALKPSKSKGNPGAYSARVLCETVLVPLAAEFHFHLGVSSPQPLNNQPYFRIERLGDDTAVRGGAARAAFDYAHRLVLELQAQTGTSEAREALRAFIAVRRRYQPRYPVSEAIATVTHDQLASCIEALVSARSEGGKRAQAAVAGLFDVFAGSDRVESGRVNDPSRHYPGDVCVRAADDQHWQKAVEVRDKPVKRSDIQIFVQKCADLGVLEAAVVMVSPAQKMLDGKALEAWAAKLGIGLTLFNGWNALVDQALFWADTPKPNAAAEAASRIEERLVAVEASPEAVVLWHSLVRGAEPSQLRLVELD